MSDTASTPTVLAPVPVIPACYGLPFMQMGLRPARKFTVHEGGRRMLAEKTARPALDLKIIKPEKDTGR